MKYYFKKELKKEALKGRSIKYMAEQIGYSTPYMYDILNRVCGCEKKLAYCITKFLDAKAEIKDYFVNEI